MAARDILGTGTYRKDAISAFSSTGLV